MVILGGWVFPMSEVPLKHSRLGVSSSFVKFSSRHHLGMRIVRTCGDERRSMGVFKLERDTDGRYTTSFRLPVTIFSPLYLSLSLSLSLSPSLALTLALCLSRSSGCGPLGC